MKVFNILFPYEGPWPRGKGDELSLDGFYSDKNPAPMNPKSDLKACHPDVLRENIMRERNEAAGDSADREGVEDVNDLLHVQE